VRMSSYHTQADILRGGLREPRATARAKPDR
jgi:hypothetical protein